MLAIAVLLSPIAAGLLAWAALRLLGVPESYVLTGGVVALLASFGLLVVTVYAGLDTCLDEDRSGIYHWSPQERFCDDEATSPALGLMMLATPLLITVVGMTLLGRGRSTAGRLVLCLFVVVPVLPWVWISSMAVYRSDDRPVLTAPLLRTETAALPARVCFHFGIREGPRGTRPLPTTMRECVDLARTPAAAALTHDYDEGRTPGAVQDVGQELTIRGLPIRPGPVGDEGLVVERAYRLTGAEAAAGAEMVY